jgi:hypothetical protein
MAKTLTHYNLNYQGLTFWNILLPFSLSLTWKVRVRTPSDIKLIVYPEWTNNPTRQTSTSRINRMYFYVLTQQLVVLLISSQVNISRRCLVEISLMSVLFWPKLDVWKLKMKVKNILNRWLWDIYLNNSVWLGSNSRTNRKCISVLIQQVKLRCHVDFYIFLTSFWCLKVEKLRSKSHGIDDYNISISTFLSGREGMLMRRKKASRLDKPY